MGVGEFVLFLQCFAGFFLVRGEMVVVDGWMDMWGEEWLVFGGVSFAEELQIHGEGKWGITFIQRGIVFGIRYANQQTGQSSPKSSPSFSSRGHLHSTP